jgi:hypothetical protein
MEPDRQPCGFAANRNLGYSWLFLCAAFALHITDEALTGFLSVYNPTVISLRARLGYWPMPTFEFRTWLTGLIVAVVLLTALTPLLFRGERTVRPLFYLFAIIMLLNGIAHTAGTIAGRTVPEVHFSRPMPGFYSSPVMIAASVYGLVQLRKTSRAHKSEGPS